MFEAWLNEFDPWAVHDDLGFHDFWILDRRMMMATDLMSYPLDPTQACPTDLEGTR